MQVFVGTALPSHLLANPTVELLAFGEIPTGERSLWELEPLLSLQMPKQEVGLWLMAPWHLKHGQIAQAYLTG